MLMHQDQYNSIQTPLLQKDTFSSSQVIQKSPPVPPATQPPPSLANASFFLFFKNATAYL